MKNTIECDALPALDLKLEAGAAFKLKTQPFPDWDGIVDCRFLEIESQRKLSYTWVVGNMGLETIVTFTLTPTAVPANATTAPAATK